MSHDVVMIEDGAGVLRRRAASVLLRRGGMPWADRAASAGALNVAADILAAW
jgi:hypothetical protein